MTRKPECVWDLIAEAVHLRLPLEDIRATSQPGLQLGMEVGEFATLAGIQEGLEGMSLGEAVLDFIGSMFHSPAPERSILLLDRKRPDVVLPLREDSRGDAYPGACGALPPHLALSGPRNLVLRSLL